MITENDELTDKSVSSNSGVDAAPSKIYTTIEEPIPEVKIPFGSPSSTTVMPKVSHATDKPLIP